VNDRRRFFLYAWLPVLLWMFFIFFLSSVPGQEIPDLSIPHFHRWVHFFQYSVLGWLWVRALLLRIRKMRYLKASVFAWILTASFACSDEWHQTFTPGRSGRLEDVIFDALCAVVGILLYLVARKKTSEKSSSMVA
jgi:VanZ family protein